MANKEKDVFLKGLISKRKELGFSQEDMAKKLNVNHTKIFFMENGKISFSIEFLIDYLNALGLDINKVFR